VEGTPVAEFAVLADGLVKRYGATTALAGASLHVATGSVCAVLGRNGAGKTTAVRVLTTLTRPDAGTVRVAGFDVLREPSRVRARIGLIGQSTSMDELLTGRANLEVIGRLHHLGARAARARAVELLTSFRLVDAGDRLVKTYSGGMRRRLDLAASLVTSPQVLFLDEPTTGLDPIARSDVWQAVRDLVAGGTTVVLTTQYLEEADQLADTVVVMDRGRIAASGTPDALKRRVGATRIQVVAVDAPGASEVASAVEAVVGTRADVTGRTVTADAPAGVASLGELIGELGRRQLAVEDVGLHRPSMDEVFARLTRRPLPYPTGRGAPAATAAAAAGARS